MSDDIMIFDRSRRVQQATLLNQTTVEAETTALLARMTTQLSATISTAYDTLIKKLKTGGGWSKLDAFYNFAAHTNTAAEAQLNWISESYNALLTNGSGGSVPTFTALKGFTGSATNKSYIRTQFNPSTAGGKFIQDSASIGAYIITSGTSADKSVIGFADGYYMYIANDYSGQYKAAINNAPTYANITTKKTPGLVSLVRDNSANYKAYHGATQVGNPTVASAALQNKEIYILGVGNFYSTDQVAFAFIGSALTVDEISAINDACIFYLTDVQNSVGIIGDSTIGTYSTFSKVSDLMTKSNYIVEDVAHSGDTIAEQKTAWTALGEKRKALDIVFVQIGLNNMAFTTPNLLAAYQDLIDTIRADIGTSKKIILSTMNPCYFVSDQQYLDLNNAITGDSATPIINADGYVSTVATALNSGTGTLAAAYDSGDGVHENDDGRQIIADLWDAKITELGF